MKASNLTKRQFAVLQFIRTFLQEEGRSPTLKEIAEGVGSSAVSTIHKHVQHLTEKGFLDRSHGVGNNIVVKETTVARTKPEAAATSRGTSASGAPGIGRLIPFLGHVAAGEPLIPDTRATPMEVPAAIHRDRHDLFVLRVHGDSMVEDSILDGDLVVLQKAGDYRNGDRVVALLDGEDVTLKEFRRDREGVWLIPHNPNLSPKCYAPDRVQVQGRLVGVMRSC
ncbi:MAG: transcriptional repressor LexA [Firmicutes bacterium]|nr:transcriptional repressor LexA [Bacillota bacterium]